MSTTKQEPRCVCDAPLPMVIELRGQRQTVCGACSRPVASLSLSPERVHVAA